MWLPCACACLTHVPSFCTGPCQRVALLRDCHPAFGLLLYVAPQSNPLAWSGWLGGFAGGGEARDLRGVCFRAVYAVYAVWTQFYPLKVLLASVGYARAAIIFVVSRFYARAVFSTAEY